MAEQNSNIYHFKEYIQTNRSFIQEKLNEMFRVELQQGPPPIGNVNINKLELLAKEIIDSDGNEGLENFNANLQRNISVFCQQQKLLNIETILEMLNFCLDNSNVIQAQQKPKPKQVVVEKKQEKIEPPQPVKMDLNEVLQRSIIQYEDLLKQPNLTRQERTVLQTSMANIKMQQLSMKSQNRKKASKSIADKYQQEHVQDPEIVKKPQLSEKQILIRKLKPLFEFACQEQQNTGKNSTFDRIKNEKINLNLGSFLILCNNLKISNKKLTRFVLIEKFKKIAQGSPQIPFIKFVQLLELLNKQDPSLYQRIKPVTDVVKIKSIRSPFSIHDKQFFRQIRLANSARKQLTSHSGKLSYSLKQQLQNRKMLRSSPRYIQSEQELSRGLVIGNKSFIAQQPSLENSARLSQINLHQKLQKSALKLEHLNSVANQIELKRLSRLIVKDEDDQFMKGYHVEEFRNKRRHGNIAINTRKRANQLEKIEQSKEISQDHKIAEYGNQIQRPK